MRRYGAAHLWGGDLPGGGPARNSERFRRARYGDVPPDSPDLAGGDHDPLAADHPVVEVRDQGSFGLHHKLGQQDAGHDLHPDPDRDLAVRRLDGQSAPDSWSLPDGAVHTRALPGFAHHFADLDVAGAAGLTAPRAALRERQRHHVARNAVPALERQAQAEQSQREGMRQLLVSKPGLMRPFLEC